MPNLRNGSKGDSNPGSLDCESGILHWATALHVVTLFTLNCKPWLRLIGLFLFVCLSVCLYINKGDSDPMSCQSLKILSFLNFAHILHCTNSHTQEEQLRQFLDKLVKHFLSYTYVSQTLKFYPEHCASLWTISPVINELGTWVIHLWKCVILKSICYPIGI